MSKKAVLIILDGYGIAPATPGNAITTAQKPNLDKLFSENPYTQLQASGLEVGLPKGQMGNSESDTRTSARAASCSRSCPR